MTTQYKNLKYPLIRHLACAINKPICFISIRTTGALNSTTPVGVVEFAYFIIKQNGTKETGVKLINPGMPISADHGIKDLPKTKKFVSLIPTLKLLFSECLISVFSDHDLSVLRKACWSHKRKAVETDYKLDINDISDSRSRNIVDVAAKYGIFKDEPRCSIDSVILSAELLEAMLLQHGEDFIIKKIVAPKGITLKNNEPINPPRLLSKKVSMSRALKTHLETHDRILDYNEIALQSDCSVAKVKLYVANMFSSKNISKNQIEDHDTQYLIEEHIESALEMTKNTTSRNDIKKALEGLMGQPVDHVQLRVALFNCVTNDRQHESEFRM